MVAASWSCSIKTIYELIDSGSLPYIVLPTPGKREGVTVPTDKKRRRLIRIRAEMAQSWVLAHEVNPVETKVSLPRRRRRSVLGAPKGVTSLKQFKNGGGAQDEDTKNA